MYRQSVRDCVFRFYHTNLFKRIEIISKINDKCFIYKVEETGAYGFSDEKGNALTPPIFKNIKSYYGKLAVVQGALDCFDGNYNVAFEKFGVFDCEKRKMFADCKYDSMEETCIEQFCLKLWLYEGANVYFINLREIGKKESLFPFWKEKMFKILELKPELFLNLKSEYFKNLHGKFNDKAIGQFLEIMSNNFENKPNEQLKVEIYNKIEAEKIKLFAVREKINSREK